jgi:hypothetical protein
VTEDQNREYSVLFGEDLKTTVVQTQVVDLWVNNKIYSLNLAKSRLDKLVIAIWHKPTNAIVGTVTGIQQYSSHLQGKYYYLGVFILPGHCDRPKILNKTYNLLRNFQQPNVKGVAILRKNSKISDNLLRRYQFEPSVKVDLYFKDFRAAG